MLEQNMLHRVVGNLNPCPPFNNQVSAKPFFEQIEQLIRHDVAMATEGDREVSFAQAVYQVFEQGFLRFS